MTAALLVLRFLLELLLFASFSFIGWTALDGGVMGIVAAVALPVVVAIGWGVLLSPRRIVDAPLWLRTVVELVLFACAAVGLWFGGLGIAGLGLMIAEIVVLAALWAVGQLPGAHPGESGRAAPKGR